MKNRIEQIVKPGTHFIMGNEACALGAIAAGCRYFAFYPITPANEIAEQMSLLLPKIGGVYLQMEDEISAIASVIGSSWTGKKAMTATSGPGFSLMQENIGYGVMTETPCVIVDVQRCGPSTGTPPLPMQADVYQARHGSHGEYEIIALAPSSAQDMFLLTVEAFNLAEAYRTPVILLSDALVGHMRETVEIPDLSKMNVVERKKPEGHRDVHPFLDEDVAPMPIFGSGYSVHVTASTHDTRGLRNVESPVSVDFLVRKLCAKIRKHKNEITRIETAHLDDAEIVLVSYGSVARSAHYATEWARRKGLKVGYVRLITLWPFPDEAILNVAKNVRKIIVLENNLGQVVNEVARVAGNKAEVQFLPPRIISLLHEPDYIIKKVEEVYK